MSSTGVAAVGVLAVEAAQRRGELAVLGELVEARHPLEPEFGAQLVVRGTPRSRSRKRSSAPRSTTGSPGMRHVEQRGRVVVVDQLRRRAACRASTATLSMPCSDDGRRLPRGGRPSGTRWPVRWHRGENFTVSGSSECMR